MKKSKKRNWTKSINEKQKRSLYISTNKRLENKIKKIKKHIKKTWDKKAKEFLYKIIKT